MASFEEALYRLWSHGDDKIPGLRAAMVSQASRLFENYGLNTKNAMLQFMAQISHECGAGLEVEENLNYSAERIAEVWPSRFPTAHLAEPYAHNPQMLANKVYNGRMGNVLGSNDGWNYRGRGATQTTGKENYNKLGIKIGIGLLRTPGSVNDPAYFLECGVQDFIMCGCLEPAIIGDIDTVTLRLNGGHIGLAERKVWLHKWEDVNVTLPTTSSHSVPDDIPLRVPNPRPQPQASGGFWQAIAAVIAAIVGAFKRG